jgi:hypothetical protein
MKKSDFEDFMDKVSDGFYIALIIIGIIALIVLCILKVWVNVNYGDMPITEVPSWAIPWLSGGEA